MTASISTRLGGNASGLAAVTLCGTVTSMDVASAAPTAAAAASPDATLLKLGRLWQHYVEHYDAIDADFASSSAAELKQKVRRVMQEVVRKRIIAMPATTLEGMDVKSLVSRAFFDA